MNSRQASPDPSDPGSSRDTVCAVAAWIASALASSLVGGMFGYLIGSSAVSLAGTAIPLIFGLLAVVGITVGAPSLFQHLGVARPTHLDRACVASCVCLFIVASWFGLQRGFAVKTYMPAESIVHEMGIWDQVSPAVLAEVQLLSAEIQNRELPRAWHWGLMRYAVAPALANQKISDDERIAFIRDLRERLPE